MASTYENDLRLEEMATGENSGSWGTKTNTNLELVADAFSYGTETIADADTAITIADGAADAARSLALKINSSEDLTTTRVVTLGPNTTSKVWIIENNTSGGQTLTISAGSGSNITLANGTTKIIATDGIGAGSNVVELTQDIAIADLSVDGILSLADGTNSAPSLTNTGDTNTGLYFPAADEVGITVGGTQVLKADSTGIDVTGTITFDGGSTSADLSFGDNDKAIFGAGSDLQIYHDGSNSYIKDSNGTGNLIIDGTNLTIRDSDTAKVAISIQNNSDEPLVELRYDNSPKLATTATGISVTGEITADGLTVDANTALFSAGTSGDMVLTLEADTDNNDEGDSPSIVFKQDGGNTLGRVGLIGNDDEIFPGSIANALYIGSDENANVQLYTALKQRVKIDNTGDVFFYEDTGTTVKFAWKSDNERLGLGTDNPSLPLHVFAGSNNTSVARFTGAQINRGLAVSTYSSNGLNDGGVDLNANDSMRISAGSSNIGFRPAGTTSDTVSLSDTLAQFNTDVRIEGAAPSLTISNTTEDVASLKLLDSADGGQNLTLAYNCQLEDGYLSIDGTTHIYFREDGNTYFGAGGGATSVPFYDAGNATQIFPQVAINSTAAGAKNDGVLALFSWGTGGNVEPELVLGHSTSGAIGDNTTALVGGNNLGRILFNGSDGTKMANGVFMFAEAAGTWTSSIAPSNLILGIEKDDGSYSSNMFSHDGYFGISDTNRWTTGGNNPNSLLHLYGAGATITIDNSTETEGGIIFRDGDAGTPDTQAAAIKFDSGSTVSNNALSFYNNDASTLRMRIYNSGEVSHPWQSCINVYRTTAVSPAVNGAIIFNSKRLDNNTDYSTSTGKYTAPVDGVYQLNAQVGFDGGNGQDDSMYIYILKNGSTLVSQATINPKYHTISGVELTYALAGTVSANAGDYFQVELADIGASGAPNMIGSATYFSGHLI
jgi:hypothetical protein